MNNRKTTDWLIVTAATIACLTVAGLNAAEKQAQPTYSTSTTSAPPPARSGTAPSSEPFIPAGSNVPGQGAESNPLKTLPRSSIKVAAEAVRDAKDEGKAEAQKKLSDLLSNYFDQDTKRREQEVKQIEDRIAKLREQLERRRSKKEEILELQMKLALNEAEGLGFYESNTPRTSWAQPTFDQPTPAYLPVPAYQPSPYYAPYPIPVAQPLPPSGIK